MKSISDTIFNTFPRPINGYTFWAGKGFTKMLLIELYGKNYTYRNILEFYRKHWKGGIEFKI